MFVIIVISVLQQKINWKKYYFQKFVKGQKSPLTAKKHIIQ